MVTSDPGVPAPLLVVEDLAVHYAATQGPIRAVDGVSFDLAEGETLALVGESGCGKSTLARAIVGLETPTRGRVRLAGEPLLPFPAATRRAQSKTIQMVFQDPDASLNPRLPIFAAVSEALELHAELDRDESTRQVERLLENVGLDRALGDRYPHELSGGQKQRVCIARALAVGPRLLVCDEAVSALDVSVQAQIIGLLVELRQRLGLSYLFITHDLRVVRQIADRVLVMYLGKLVELASADDLYGAPEHPYTSALLEAVPTLDRGAPPRAALGEVPSPSNPPAGCHFHPRCPSVMDRCRREPPPLYRLGTRRSRCFLSEPKSISENQSSAS